MLVVFLLSLLYHDVTSEILMQVPNSQDQALMQCITNVLQRYYIGKKELTFVDIKSDDDGILQAINSMEILPLILRQSNYKMEVTHEGYLITTRDANDFTKYFWFLTREQSWNPYARFLIVIRYLRTEDLDHIFTALLKQHVFNALIINGTENTDLYTYNPFNNYACGKHYDNVISYGHCSNNTQDLFPKKLVTGLSNCTVNAVITHWPPYTINPQVSRKGPKVGAEQSIIQVIADLEGFKVNFRYVNDGEDFSIITDDMVAIGLLSKLQNDEADAIMGGMVLVPTRAYAFSYVYEHLTYIDEIRFIVKKAKLVAAWKNVYLEFQPTVWVLLILALIIYWLLMFVLLHFKDKTYLMLRLLDNLLLHGFDIRCRLTVKCIFILWVWFAYLVNTFYQSSLVSITTNPIKEYQISSEEDLIKHKFRSCASMGMKKYYTDVTHTDYSHDVIEGCQSILEGLATVAKRSDLYTVLFYSLYSYNHQQFCDEFGTPLVYSFKKPYAKVIYSMFFYKGFPMREKLGLDALRLRENGLADKFLNDMQYLRDIKQRHHAQEFHLKLLNPFFGYLVACSVAFIMFVVEIVSKNK